MKYLLDTCALIYMVFAPDRLSSKAADIVSGDSELYVSIASITELVYQMKKVLYA